MICAISVEWVLLGALISGAALGILAALAYTHWLHNRRPRFTTTKPD